MIFSDVVAPSVPQGTPAHVARTRDRVLQEISERGPVTAADLARRLGLTPAAVRRHLDALGDAGLVQEATRTVHGDRGRGRPARAYVLSEAGHAGLRDGYDDLALSALDFIDREGGAAAVRRFATQRAERMAFAARPAVEAAGADPAARIEALARSLTGQGYAASTRPIAGGDRSRQPGAGGDGTTTTGVQLCQGHCPVRHAAAEHPELCETEAQMFSELLGVHVQRLAALAHGDHVCTTFVPTNVPPNSVSHPSERTRR